MQFLATYLLINPSASGFVQIKEPPPGCPAVSPPVEYCRTVWADNVNAAMTQARKYCNKGYAVKSCVEKY